MPLTMFLIAAAGPLLILILGALPLLVKNVTVSVVLEVFGHVVSWLVIAMALLFWVPSCIKIFESFNQQLPGFTVLFIHLREFVTNGWHIHGPFIVSLLVLDGWMFQHLSKLESQRSLRWKWSLLMTALPLVIASCTSLAMVIPLSSLMSDLS